MAALGFVLAAAILVPTLRHLTLLESEIDRPETAAETLAK
jgi:hypothetical protein